MEEKKYEGRVEITSAEYRELVTEMVKAQKEASDASHRSWKAERENTELKNEIALLQKKVEELESHNAKLQIFVSSVAKEAN